jgi:hypothetical protein
MKNELNKNELNNLPMRGFLAKVVQGLPAQVPAIKTQ